MSGRKKPNQDSQKRSYEVGYGRPPKHSQYPKGHSGNPKGKRKGVRNFKTDVKATLKEPVSVKRDGKIRKVSTQEAMLLRLREKVLNGDQRAIDRLLELAQTHNNEELVADVKLSAGDAEIMAAYKKRLLSEAADTPSDSDATDTPETETSNHDPASDAHSRSAIDREVTIEEAWARSGIDDEPASAEKGEDTWLN